MHRIKFNTLSLVVTTLLTCLPSVLAVSQETEPVDFVRDIRPILSDNCYACHGPDEEKLEADLRLDQKESALGELPSGETAIIPGNPDESELVRRITSTDEDLLMPPAETGKSLKPEQIEVIRRWIQQGAEWQQHWSFIPPQRPELPKVSNKDWTRNEIDHFILSRLDKEGLEPNSDAQKEILLRRVTFDLTGLPPTLQQLDEFLADESQSAYESAVDRLLNSPHYGEHMARFWLDAARYGDTHGLHLDNYREIWPYRDWVVRAFNDNMPYDQFTIEQLAGDLLPNATLSQRVATGFNRCNVSTSEGGSIEEEVYVRNVVDRVTTMGTVFMGLTLECTRCHNHKFDPLTMNDFYSLFAFFNSIDGPALDGNHHDTQPSEQVPTPEQAAILHRTAKRVSELEVLQTKHREGMESVFQQWLAEQQSRSSNGVPAENTASGEGLVGHYPLSAEPEGKVTNSVTPEKSGSIQGDAKSVPGHSGEAIGISAEGYVDLGNVFDFNHDSNFSFGAWVKVPKDASGTILSKMTDEQRGYALILNKGQVSLLLSDKKDSNGIHIASAENSISPDSWHHVFVTYDGSAKAAGATIYIDGKRQPSNIKRDDLVHRGVPRSFSSGKASLRIGRLASTQPLVGGQVDDVRIYDRRIGLAEVIGVMANAGIDELLAQPSDQLTPEQVEDVRQYYFHFYDTAYAEMVDQLDQAHLERTNVQTNLPISLIWRERKEPREAFILTRGEYDQKGEKVERATPAVFASLPENAPRNRLGLAQWLVAPQNPLTARVAVNRFWAQVMGTGLVKTAEDFGSQGEVPTHPKLLDWLATEFIESGWDTKSLMKSIVMSSTYRQSSRMSPEKLEKDPENRLLAHGPRYRLDAEMLRDQALEASGLLVKKIGGPGVKPPQPDGLWFAVGYSGSNTVRFVADTVPEKVHRRTIYTFLKRTSPPPQMSTFDAPSREACIVRRERTNTPLQALLMLNDPQYVEAARALAERVIREGGEDGESRVRMMLRLCTSRKANQASVDELLALYRDQLQRFSDNIEGAQSFVGVGLWNQNENIEISELAAWTMVANVVLNLDEVVSKN